MSFLFTSLPRSMVGWASNPDAVNANQGLSKQTVENRRKLTHNIKHTMRPYQHPNIRTDANQPYLGSPSPQHGVCHVQKTSTMATTLIHAPEQPASPNEHRTPGLSRHLQSAAPAQPLPNLRPVVLSKARAPSATPLRRPRRIVSTQKKNRTSAQHFADTQHRAMHHGWHSFPRSPSQQPPQREQPPPA